MPVLTRELIVNVRDPNRAGLLRSFDSQTPGDFGVMTPPNERWGIRLVEPSDEDANNWQDVDPTGGALQIDLGSNGVALVEQTAFTPYPGAAYSLTVLQVGDATHPSIRVLTLDPPPYDGQWKLQGIALLAHAAASDVQNALGAGYGVLKPDLDAAVWIVTQTANGVANALTLDLTGLVVPTGMIVDVALGTPPIMAAFAGTDDPQIVLSLQGQIALPGQDQFTFLLIDVPMSRGVLNPGSDLLGTSAAVVIVNAATGALISPTAAAFYSANPPPTFPPPASPPIIFNG